VPNFPPLTTINYSVAPANPIQAYILYEFVFGQAMVPHSFDVKIRHGASTLLNIIVSGRFTSFPTSTFAVIGHQQPALGIAATNLRLLTNYFELTSSFVTIATVDGYNLVIDALRRMHTSAKSEELAAEANTLLQSIPGIPPVAPREPI
ncbi:hypothetical protein LCGC14_3131650, partial [marine sediment metagenome]